MDVGLSPAQIDFVVTGGVSVATPVGPRVPWWHFCRSGLGLVALFPEGVAYRSCGVFGGGGYAVWLRGGLGFG